MVSAMRKFLISLFSSLMLSGTALLAGSLERVELPPITHMDATLTVVRADGSHQTYTPAQLETLPTYSLTTRTPWRDDPATFEGVRLRDILSAAGLDPTADIRVLAENDFSTRIPSEVIRSIDILVATRVDGRAHTRRARGPIQFVLDMESYERSEHTDESNYVWMAARIEPET